MTGATWRTPTHPRLPEQKTSRKQLRSLIAGKRADIYGFSSICSSYPLTIRIAKALKTLQPSATVLFGGPQASVVDIQTLAAFPFVDMVLRGEAERSLPLLLDELQGAGQLDRVPGLTYRADEGPKRNAAAPVIADLDALPTPAYHLTGCLLRRPERTSLELGRGCPFACSFCSTNDFFRRNFRLRSPQRVLADMQAIAQGYGIRSFILVHDMFTVDRRKVVEFCEEMIASGEDFTWSCSARTDCVDEGLLELMARAGCRSIFFGIEVGSVKMQRVIDKDLDPQRAEEIIDVAERLGIRTTVSMISGFPEETWHDVRETMRIFMHSARCSRSNPQLNILAPLSETPLYSKYSNQLTLDDLCSDMSHQGRFQDGADLELIRKHPEIFPNFYLLPTPHLDRTSLLELREFTLIGVGRFRWLLSAIDQRANFLDFFHNWREFRLQRKPGLMGADLRYYYRIQEFRTDFVTFVQDHAVGQDATVKALLECEQAVQRRTASDLPIQSRGQILAKNSAIRPTDVPTRTRRAAVVELSCDIQRVVDALKICGEPVWVRGPHFYTTQKAEDGMDRLVQISRWMALLLRACDGQRDVARIVHQMRNELSHIARPLRAYAVTKLLEGAREQGYIRIYRAPDKRRASPRTAAKARPYR